MFPLPVHVETYHLSWRSGFQYLLGLNLDPLNCLFDVLQQSFVLLALVLLLVSVHVCESGHVSVEVLFTDRLLWISSKHSWIRWYLQKVEQWTNSRTRGSLFSGIRVLRLLSRLKFYVTDKDQRQQEWRHHFNLKFRLTEILQNEVSKRILA